MHNTRVSNFPIFQKKNPIYSIYTIRNNIWLCYYLIIIFRSSTGILSTHVNEIQMKKICQQILLAFRQKISRKHIFSHHCVHINRMVILSKKSTLFICIESGVLACIIKPAVYWMGSTKWFILKQLTSQNEGIRRKHDNIMHNIWVNILHLTKIVYFCEKNGREILLGAWFHLWYAIYSVLNKTIQISCDCNSAKLPIKKTRNENWFKRKKQRNLLWFLKFNCSN